MIAQPAESLNGERTANRQRQGLFVWLRHGLDLALTRHLQIVLMRLVNNPEYRGPLRRRNIQLGATNSRKTYGRRSSVLREALEHLTQEPVRLGRS